MSRSNHIFGRILLAIGVALALLAFSGATNEAFAGDSTDTMMASASLSAAAGSLLGSFVDGDSLETKGGSYGGGSRSYRSPRRSSSRGYSGGYGGGYGGSSHRRYHRRPWYSPGGYGCYGCYGGSLTGIIILIVLIVIAVKVWNYFQD